MYINELSIYCRDLHKQQHFYTEVLGLKMIDKWDDSVTFVIGKSLLRLEPSPDFKPYHFAINIPSNQISGALQWLRSRVVVLKDGDREIQDFTSWNAKALYFYDTDFNIVEFIARRTLQNESESAFSQTSLLEISEIGMPTDDIERVYNAVHHKYGLPVYSGDFGGFCAIGDEHGLLICIDKYNKLWYPTNDPAYSSDFKLVFTAGGEACKLRYDHGKLNIDR
ncbi:MAG TPA: VOC family protein [Eudoraea sp.]|nr:VOC family protein [Eudoraea sp.]